VARNVITEDMTVEEIIEQYPATSRVFLRRRMHCVGCPIAKFETISDACLIYREPIDEMLAALNAEATSPPA
jgi:hybrid cluster-associated redox disulfide protein